MFSNVRSNIIGMIYFNAIYYYTEQIYETWKRTNAID